jgi:hypothetical protein
MPHLHVGEMEFETKLALIWIGAGLLGTVITFLKNIDEMKEKE